MKKSTKLNFGCGNDIRKDYVNVDILNHKGVDKVFDFNKFPYPLKNNSFDYIYADNVFEHLLDLEKVIKELYRISKDRAIIEVIVPYYNYSGAFNSAQHIHFFNNKTLGILFGRGDTDLNKLFLYKIIESKIIPRKRLQFIPHDLLITISHFIPNLIENVYIKVEIIKFIN